MAVGTTSTAAWLICGCTSSAVSISPSSMRWPRNFTWKSVRTRSPVRYIRCPATNGFATKRSALRSGRAT
ncbi:Uncharacterised protein [Mycobacteroides abscessus subsp. abscessus]|nr:Uncharacterised protein [Mycobacteroides abscessus subsp. abscessus]